MNKQMYELSPQFDTVKSFGNNARVEIENNVKSLYSYNTLVATIQNDNLSVLNTQSNTTVRHIKEFAKQNGFKAETKKQIESDYYIY